MLVKHGERGQALVETLLFLPIALAVLFAILYFARLGVLEERAQSAVRYGAIVSFESATKYSAADIYAALDDSSPPITTCDATIATDALTVLNGTGTGGSARPFWKPDHAPVSTCAVSTMSFPGNYFSAYHYLTVTKHTVTAAMDVPSYISSSIGVTGTVSASLGYAHSDPPSVIMYCVSTVGYAVAAGLNATFTSGSC